MLPTATPRHLDDDVAPLQAGPFGRPPGHDPREPQPLDFGPVVGDGCRWRFRVIARPGLRGPLHPPRSPAAPARRSGAPPPPRRSGAIRSRSGKLMAAVSSLGRVVVLVAAGEQREARHVGPDEADRVVRRQVGVAEPAGDSNPNAAFTSSHQVGPDAAASQPLRGQRVVPHAPRPCRSSRTRPPRSSAPLRGPRSPAKPSRPNLLAGPEAQHDAARALPTRQHGPRAASTAATPRRIVVGPVVDPRRPRRLRPANRSHHAPNGRSGAPSATYGFSAGFATVGGR